jgi:hypothetical protein
VQESQHMIRGQSGMHRGPSWVNVPQPSCHAKGSILFVSTDHVEDREDIVHCAWYLAQHLTIEIVDLDPLSTDKESGELCCIHNLAYECRKLRSVQECASTTVNRGRDSTMEVGNLMFPVVWRSSWSCGCCTGRIHRHST